MQRTGLILATFVVTLWSGMSLAHTSSDGENFSTDYNPRGAVMTSADTIIFLDSSCGAASSEYGSGTWEWSNGGFTIKLKKKTFGFPRQELEIDDHSKCQAGADEETESATSSGSPRQPAQSAQSAKNGTPAPVVRQVYDLCVKDQVESEMTKWGEDPANHRALAIERANALRKAHASANTMCECVTAPLKSGKQSVAADFMSEAGYYKKMQFVCSMDSGPEEFMKQFGN
jgi:hypothetical protein